MKQSTFAVLGAATLLALGLNLAQAAEPAMKAEKMKSAPMMDSAADKKAAPMKSDPMMGQGAAKKPDMMKPDTMKSDKMMDGGKK